jgi:hypothetical protein
VRVYAVVSDESDKALELFVDRQMAQLMVENWNRDEPERAGALRSSRSSSRRRRTSPLRPRRNPERAVQRRGKQRSRAYLSPQYGGRIKRGRSNLSPGNRPPACTLPLAPGAPAPAPLSPHSAGLADRLRSRAHRAGHHRHVSHVLRGIRPRLGLQPGAGPLTFGQLRTRQGADPDAAATQSQLDHGLHAI